MKDLENIEELHKKYKGTTYEYPGSLEFISSHGKPETLNTTTVFRWIAYFPESDFTIYLDKTTGLIDNICHGKNPNITKDEI